ncbi:hypothetical protein Bbelb_056950, partial [Branchiostoma belcheri]
TSLLALEESKKEGTVSTDDKYGDHDSDGEARSDDGGHVREVRDFAFSDVQCGIIPGRVCVGYCSTTRCHGGWWWSRRRCHVRHYCCQHQFQLRLI